MRLRGDYVQFLRMKTMRELPGATGGHSMRTSSI